LDWKRCITSGCENGVFWSEKDGASPKWDCVNCKISCCLKCGVLSVQCKCGACKDEINSESDEKIHKNFENFSEIFPKIPTNDENAKKWTNEDENAKKWTKDNDEIPTKEENFEKKIYGSFHAKPSTKNSGEKRGSYFKSYKNGKIHFREQPIREYRIPSENIENENVDFNDFSETSYGYFSPKDVISNPCKNYAPYENASRHSHYKPYVIPQNYFSSYPDRKWESQRWGRKKSRESRDNLDKSRESRDIIDRYREFGYNSKKSHESRDDLDRNLDKSHESRDNLDRFLDKSHESRDNLDRFLDKSRESRDNWDRHRESRHNSEKPEKWWKNSKNLDHTSRTMEYQRPIKREDITATTTTTIYSS